MKIGIVGYQGSGKSSLFHWLTGVEPDPGQAHLGQAAMSAVPDERMGQLSDIYNPKKMTYASLELVDTPGLARDHQGNAGRLAIIREAGCLIVVVAGYDHPNPVADLASFEEDLLLADLEIVSGRVDRLRESLKKPIPRPAHELQTHELEALAPLVDVLESGKPLTSVTLSDEQLKATRSFRLLTEKPRLTVINVADDEPQPERLVEAVAAAGASHGGPVLGIPVRLQTELSALDEADRAEMVAEMGLIVFDRDPLVRQILNASGQMLFFTAGEKEVRSWMIDQGGTAVEAAGSIHTDMARGFIRAETIACTDLVQSGSERDAKAAHLYRQEPKDYVLQDGDVLNMKFSV